MGEIIPFPVWTIPFPVYKTGFGLLSKYGKYFVFLIGQVVYRDPKITTTTTRGAIIPFPVCKTGFGLHSNVGRYFVKTVF